MRVRNDLDKLSLTGKWSLREADLYDYKRELDSIDEKRVDGNWLDDNGKPAELYIQRVRSGRIDLSRFKLLMRPADLAIPGQEELWIYLLADDRLEARVRGSSTNL